MQACAYKEGRRRSDKGSELDRAIAHALELVLLVIQSPLALLVGDPVQVSMLGNVRPYRRLVTGAARRSGTDRGPFRLRHDIQSSTGHCGALTCGECA
jgi:hypothetical protein